MLPEPLLVPPPEDRRHLHRRWALVEGMSKADSDLRLYLARGELLDPWITHGEVVKAGGWVFSQTVGEPFKVEFDGPIINRAIPRCTVRDHPARQWETRMDGEQSCVLMWNEPTGEPETARRYFMVSPLDAFQSAQVELANRLIERRV